MVNISLRVLSHPDVEFLPWIYVNLGMDFDYRVLPSIGNEVLKAVVVRRWRAVPPRGCFPLTAIRSSQAQFNADQLLTQREKVSLQIRDQLTVRASDFHLTLVRPLPATLLASTRHAPRSTLARRDDATRTMWPSRTSPSAASSLRPLNRSRSLTRTRSAPSTLWSAPSTRSRPPSSGRRARRRRPSSSRRPLPPAAPASSKSAASMCVLAAARPTRPASPAAALPFPRSTGGPGHCRHPVSVPQHHLPPRPWQQCAPLPAVESSSGRGPGGGPPRRTTHCAESPCTLAAPRGAVAPAVAAPAPGRGGTAGAFLCARRVCREGRGDVPGGPHPTAGPGQRTARCKCDRGGRAPARAG